jgi:hypothetical protein
MKKVAMALMALVLGVAFMASAGFAADKKYSGFLGDYYKNLKPGPDGGAKERWLKPGVDFSNYKKLMVHSVIFYFADDSEDKGIDAAEMMELTDAFNQELIDTLKDTYPFVTEPGPDVARVRIAITNVKKSKPGVSAVTSVLPIGLAVSLVKKGATGSYSGGGATSAEVAVLDSMSNDVIALAVDEQDAGFTERFSKLGSAKEAFKFWATRLKTFLDQTRAQRIK